jgi:SAM-dependent methyltransferase
MTISRGHVPPIENRRRQREHWEKVAQQMPDLFPASSTQYYRHCEIALIKRSFGDLRGKRVLKLDLWNEAVNTRILNWMQSEGAEVYGIDISYTTTSRAYQKSQSLMSPMHVAQADIRHLPFQSNSFDLVYTMGTIEHIDEYAEAVREVRRVLKDGGAAIIGVPHKWNIFLRPLLVTILSLFNKYPYSPEKSFSYGALRRVVEESGLRVRRRTGILALPGIIRMADIFFFTRRIFLHRLIPVFLWPFDYIETQWAWPGFFGYLIAVVVEKQIL